MVLDTIGGDTVVRSLAVLRPGGHLVTATSEDDPELIARWRFPEGMTSTVERLDGGAFRVTLTYDDPATPGKSGGHRDAYRARFTRLVPFLLEMFVRTYAPEGARP